MERRIPLCETGQDVQITYFIHTQVALNVLNLNCRSSPLPLSHSFHRPESTSAVVWFVSSSVFSPRDGEMSLAETILGAVLWNPRNFADAERPGDNVEGS